MYHQILEMLLGKYGNLSYSDRFDPQACLKACKGECCRNKSGLLAVVRREELLVMDFPSRKPTPCDISKQIVDGLGVKPTEVLRARDYLAVFDSEEQVRNIQPDLEALKKLDCLGIINTSIKERKNS